MRKGIGTTLGILIFVGILFSTYIPLQLYIKQTRNILILTEKYTQINDLERKEENIYVIAYPLHNTSNQVNITILNKGSINTTVRHLWIENNCTEMDATLFPGEHLTFGPYNLILVENKTYPVKTITERGRIFTSYRGNLKYYEGSWLTNSYGISIQIANEKGKYYISANSTALNDPYQTLGQDFDDVTVFFDIETPGVYEVICKKNDSSGPDLPGSPFTVSIPAESGSPVAFIYTSGLST